MTGYEPGLDKIKGDGSCEPSDRSKSRAALYGQRLAVSSQPAARAGCGTALTAG